MHIKIILINTYSQDILKITQEIPNYSKITSSSSIATLRML
nr:MAG TPA: OAR domain protein [Caudoviricetes sp.]